MKPWMPDSQIDLIKRYLKSQHIMLEYGCGGSTLFFSKYVKTYVCIEHDKKWIQKIQKKIEETKPIPSNIELHYCDTNNPIKLPVWRGSYEDFENYINYIEKLKYKNYDVVLIDGRARKHCAKKILPYTNSESIIFFHDFFERPRYHDILQYYQIIDEDKPEKNKQTLAILKKLPQTDDA